MILVRSWFVSEMKYSHIFYPSSVFECSTCLSDTRRARVESVAPPFEQASPVYVVMKFEIATLVCFTLGWISKTPIGKPGKWVSGGNIGHPRGGWVLRSLRSVGQRQCDEGVGERGERSAFDSQQLFSFSLFIGSHVSQLFEIPFFPSFFSFMFVARHWSLSADGIRRYRPVFTI